MDIYLLDDYGKPDVHPMFAHVGTWTKGSTCKICGNHNSVLTEPLKVDWFDGSVDIGDFSWCGYTAVVLDHVKEYLVANKFEVKFGKVEVVKPTGKARMPRVPFPYVGPHLNWLISTKTLLLDEEKSGIEKIPDCPRCGQKRTKFVREGIFVPKANWSGEMLFRIEQNEKSSAKFVTEEAVALLKKEHFSNYVLKPAGKIGA